MPEQTPLTADVAKYVIESSVDGLMVINGGGLVLFANPSATALFAGRTEQLLGFHVGTPAISDSVELILPGIDSIRYVEMRAAEIVWEGQRATLASLRDITDRKQMEGALLESEVHFRTIADFGQALIWTSGFARERDYFNQPWLSFTGRSLSQESGAGWEEGMHPQDLPAYLNVYSGSFDRRERFTITYRIRRFDGEYRWIEDRASPRFNSRGVFLGYIGHCLDITEQKQAQEALALRTTELYEAHTQLKMLDGAKDDFLKIIAHELRTPLHGLLGVGEIILGELDGSPESEQLRRLFAVSRQRMLSIVEDALLLSRIDVDGAEMVFGQASLSLTLKRAVEATSIVARSRRVRIVAPQEDLNLVRGEEDLLAKAFHELARTAVQLSQEDGLVHITAQTKTTPFSLTFDVGNGSIPEAVMERFFDVFSISEALGPGGDLGLGPAVASRILSLFGARVTVANLEPAGIRFTVLLMPPPAGPTSVIALT
jgi:PAS domain S-box-containing protein